MFSGAPGKLLRIIFCMKSNTLKRIRVILILLFSCMLLAGVMLGEPETVWRKAMDLCLECIGIGG